MSHGNIHTRYANIKYQYKYIHPKTCVSLGNIHTRYANINININIHPKICMSLGNIHTRYANISIKSSFPKICMSR